MTIHGNNLSLGRNWYTADSARMVTGPDWARWELHWSDGAFIQGVEDSRAEALDALARYGFVPSKSADNIAATAPT